MATTQRRNRRTRSDGERSRATILDAAARLATVEGLDGLSIGQLADSIGMSKSGLYAHFGSKEELQLATVDAAEKIYEREVVKPALASEPGLARLRALCEGFLSHVERDVFPGGCFFASAAAELDTRSGPVRDRIAEVVRAWGELIGGALRDAQARGELDGAADIERLTFQLNALLSEANAIWVLQADGRVFDWARRGVDEALAAAS
jgi:AcrR family transcriptional regulator